MNLETELRAALADSVAGVRPRPDAHQHLIDRQRRRARTRTRAGWTVVAAAVLAAILVGTTGVLLHQTVRSAPLARPTAAPTGISLAGVQWAGASDPQHLYAIVAHCPSGVMSCTNTFESSSDGGSTWQPGPSDAPDLVYLGPGRTLIGLRPGGSARPGTPRPGVDLVSSVDGGRHWTAFTTLRHAVSSATVGSFVLCVPRNGLVTGACTLTAFDPVRRVAAPLATQPTFPPGTWMLDVRDAGGPGVAPDLWVQAINRGLSVAVSADGGRHWNTAVVDPDCQGAGVIWHAGDAGEVACRTASDEQRLYLTQDHGVTWRRLAVPRPYPFTTTRGEQYGLQFLSDGSVIGSSQAPGNAAVQVWRLRPAGWQRVPTTPLSNRDVVTAVPGGGLLANASGGGEFYLYLSPDLTTWRKIPVP